MPVAPVRPERLDLAFSLGTLASQLARSPNSLRPFACSSLGRLFIRLAEFHFTKQSLALHLFLERAQRLVHVVFSNDNLHLASPHFQLGDIGPVFVANSKRFGSSCRVATWSRKRAGIAHPFNRTQPMPYETAQENETWQLANHGILRRTRRRAKPGCRRSSARRSCYPPRYRPPAVCSFVRFSVRSSACTSFLNHRDRDHFCQPCGRQCS